jgi:hypothetical protein
MIQHRERERSDRKGGQNTEVEGGTQQKGKERGRSSGGGDIIV